LGCTVGTGGNTILGSIMLVLGHIFIFASCQFENGIERYREFYLDYL